MPETAIDWFGDGPSEEPKAPATPPSPLTPKAEAQAQRALMNWPGEAQDDQLPDYLGVSVRMDETALDRMTSQVAASVRSTRATRIKEEAAKLEALPPAERERRLAHLRRMNAIIPARTLYTEPLANLILMRVSAGETLTRVCRDMSMPSTATVNAWVLGNLHGFGRRMAEARRLAAMHMADECRDIADRDDGDVVSLRTEDGVREVLNTVGIARDKLRISVVAQRLGYESEAAFSRAFKRVIGSAPSQVRAGVADRARCPGHVRRPEGQGHRAGRHHDQRPQVRRHDARADRRHVCRPGQACAGDPR